MAPAHSPLTRADPHPLPNSSPPPHLVICRPGDPASFIRALQRCSDLVALQPIDLALLQRGQGHKAVGLVDKPSLLAGALALDHQMPILQVVGGAKGIGLADAPPQLVVAVVAALGHPMAADLGLHQQVGRIPAQPGLAALLAALVAVLVGLKIQVLVRAQAVIRPPLAGPKRATQPPPGPRTGSADCWPGRRQSALAKRRRSMR